MPLEFNPPTLSIFHTFKTKKDQLTGEALRQRSITSLLATEKNSATKTRTAISQSIGKKNGIVWKNIYSGIFRDVDEILIPLGIVKEAGRLPLLRGPKALQEKGIPFYELTNEGLLVALSIDESSGNSQILDEFLSKAEIKEKNLVEFFVEDGTVEFLDNNLLILTSTAKSLDSLDKNSIDVIIKNSQEKIDKGEISDKEKYLLSYKIDTLREINQ